MQKQCLLCGSTHLEELKAFANILRVTSDAKLFKTGGTLAICKICDLIQKYPDQKWLEEIATIYSNYTTFSADLGVDQDVYDVATNLMRPRCSIIYDGLVNQGCVSGNTIHWLDYGTARGAMLSAINAKNVEKYGYDIDDTHLSYLTKIPNFSNLYTEINPPTKQFDVISMIHSLEHFSNPLVTLETVNTLMRDDGLLFIQVNDTHKNLFDIAVADHLTHFDANTLSQLIERAGFEIIFTDNRFIQKEISLLAKKTTKKYSIRTNIRSSAAQINKQLNWLALSAGHIQKIADSKKLLIFGSAVAATWFYGQIPTNVIAFVDEDEKKIGKKHFGLNIISPDDIKRNDLVYLGLIPSISKKVYERFPHLSKNLILPPEMS